ncbi:MAG: O-antigen ligase family protein [Chloroflexi bacterium]|nr:O-antigen ligase family protein [Chloroflexota bacterium]
MTRALALASPLHTRAIYVLTLFSIALFGSVVGFWNWRGVGALAGILVSLLVWRRPAIGVVILMWAAAYENFVIVEGPFPLIDELTAGKAAGAVVFLGGALALVSRRAAFPRAAAYMVPLGFVALACLSGAWATDNVFFALRLQRLLMVFVAFWLTLSLLSDLSSVKWVTSQIWIAGGMTSAIALISFLMQTEPSSSAFGEARVAGGIGDPNEFAMYQLMTVPFAVSACVGEEGWLRKWAARVGLVLIMLAIIVSASRGGLLALATSLFAFAYVKRATLRVRWLVIGLVILVVLLGSFGTPLVSRFLSTSNLSETLAAERRPTLWSVGLTALLENPLTGVGLGNVASPQVYFSIEDRIPGLQVYGTAAVIHNGFLEIGAELGVVGLGLFLALLMGLIYRCLGAALRANLAGEPRLGAALQDIAVSLVGGGVALLFLSGQYEKMLWLVLAISQASVLIVRSLPTRRAPLVSSDGTSASGLAGKATREARPEQSRPKL